MYLGGSSISALSQFISGFEFARDLDTSSYEQEEPPFRHFNAWLGRGYRRDGGGASYPRILKSEAYFVDWDVEAAALDMFFELLDEFRRRQPLTQAFIDFNSPRMSTFVCEFDHDSKPVPLTTSKVVIDEYRYKKGEIGPRYTNFKPVKEFYLTYAYVNQYGQPQIHDDWFDSLDAAKEHGAAEFGFSLADWVNV